MKRLVVLLKKLLVILLYGIGLKAVSNTFKNKKTAAEIAGTDVKNMSTAQRTGASLASAASALTGGLISAKTMYKAGSILKYTPLRSCY